jgi:hypothetical protein
MGWWDGGFELRQYLSCNDTCKLNITSKNAAEIVPLVQGKRTPLKRTLAVNVY